MSNPKATEAVKAIRTHNERAPLPADRIGSLVQVSAGIEVTEGGAVRQARVEVTRSRFVGLLLADAPELVDLVPELKTPHAALTAAITRGRKGLKERGAYTDESDGKRYLWRRLGVDDNGLLSYALVGAHADANAKEWSGGQLATVVVDKTGAIDVSWSVTPNRQDENVVEAVVDRYTRETQMLHSDDVRKFINLMFEDDAKEYARGKARASDSIHVGGMLHLVPAPHDERFERAERALVDAGYLVTIQPITDGARHRRAVEQGLSAQISRLHRDVQEMADRHQKQDNVRLPTTETMLDKARDLADRARVYRDLVGLVVDDVDTAIEETERLVKDVQRSILFG